MPRSYQKGARLVRGIFREQGLLHPSHAQLFEYVSLKAGREYINPTHRALFCPLKRDKTVGYLELLFLLLFQELRTESSPPHSLPTKTGDSPHHPWEAVGFRDSTIRRYNRDRKMGNCDVGLARSECKLPRRYGSMVNILVSRCCPPNL